ncbi:class I SAM-dependent methyltransferase [Streptomyces sp. NPDC090306]|uniref:methyltransferase domain-containing protein n=1 Tax=unclassified Streptomyces TaxID=2593676 RepID=UPI0036E79448
MEDTHDSEYLLSKMWQRNYDPRTMSIIEGLAPAPTWKCLDMGAGMGSMSSWLAERVPEGSVLAVDTNTRYLEPLRDHNLTVRQADLLAPEFEPGTFDLVLARAVLSSVRSPSDLLDRAVEWVAPGGWLVVEDFYFMPPDDAPTPLGRAVVEGYTKAFALGGSDVRFARRLPARLAIAGLEAVDFHVRALGPGTGPQENELMRARMELQGRQLVDAGLVRAEDVDAFVDSLDRPESRDVTTLLFSAWGRKPH